MTIVIKQRRAHIDYDQAPPMRYLVADGCPKLLEGHAFYACRCFGPPVPNQSKPSILVSCDYLRGATDVDLGGAVEWTVRCGHGGDRVSGSGVQFGIPTVSHVPRYPREADDGSAPD